MTLQAGFAGVTAINFMWFHAHLGGKTNRFVAGDEKKSRQQEDAHDEHQPFFCA
jgi:hypothetical protein